MSNLETQSSRLCLHSQFEIRTSHFETVAERAFVAQWLAWVNVAFDDEVGLPAEASGRRQALGKTVFNSGKMFSRQSESCFNEPIF
jgi:hypothetical protein